MNKNEQNALEGLLITFIEYLLKKNNSWDRCG